MLRSQHPGRRAAWCRVCAYATAPRSLLGPRPSMRTRPVEAPPLCAYADGDRGVAPGPRSCTCGAHRSVRADGMCFKIAPCATGSHRLGRSRRPPHDQVSHAPPVPGREPPASGRRVWISGRSGQDPNDPWRAPSPRPSPSSAAHAQRRASARAASPTAAPGGEASRRGGSPRAPRPVPAPRPTLAVAVDPVCRGTRSRRARRRGLIGARPAPRGPSTGSRS